MKMEDQLKKIHAFLINEGYNVAHEIKDNQIRVKYPPDELTFNLSIGLTKCFPYDFPLVYVSKEFRDRIKLHAHMFQDQSLCLKLEGKEIINPSRECDVVKYALEKAIEIINRAMMDELNDDRYLELKNYWSNKSTKDNIVESAVSFYQDNNLNEDWSFGSYILSEGKIILYNSLSNYCGKDYVGQINYGSDPNVETGECLFITFETNKSIDIFKRLPFLRKYLFLLNNPIGLEYLYIYRSLYIVTLISREDLGEQYAFAFQLKEGVSFQSVLDSASVEEVDEMVQSVDFFVPSLLTQKSLFQRSSRNDVMQNLDFVCIVGCGSIGSHLAEAYASIGVKKMWLIDHDIFKVENLLRHKCSMSEVGKNKAHALKHYLLMNYPYLDVSAFGDKVFALDEGKFTSDFFDLVVVATGDLSSEYYCLEKLLMQGITDEVALFWVEPFAVSGHVLVFKNPPNRFLQFDFDVFYSNVRHNSLIENRADYYHIEAGCNSAYIPYSGLDIQRFISSYITDHDALKKRGSYSYNIILSSEQIERKEMKINPSYQNIEKNSVIVRNLHL